MLKGKGHTKPEILHGTHTIVVTKGGLLAYKINGNQADVTIKIESGADPVTGLCLAVMGNQAHVKVVIAPKSTVQALNYFGRGNESRTSVDIQAEGALAAVQADIAGNQGRLELKGAGKFTCPQPNLHGNDTAVVCP